MQRSRLYYELEALSAVIAAYNQTVDSLSESETRLMKQHLLDTERHILPGLTRLTWTALGINDYIADITKCEILAALCGVVVYFSSLLSI